MSELEKLAEKLAEKYAEENSINICDMEYGPIIDAVKAGALHPTMVKAIELGERAKVMEEVEYRFRTHKYSPTSADDVRQECWVEAATARQMLAKLLREAGVEGESLKGEK